MVCSHSALTLYPLAPPLYSSFQFTASSAAASAARAKPVPKRARRNRGEEIQQRQQIMHSRKLTDFTICCQNVKNVERLKKKSYATCLDNDKVTGHEFVGAELGSRDSLTNY